jgi:uncharacterized repeat protein (TIGR01451 family)
MMTTITLLQPLAKLLRSLLIAALALSLATAVIERARVADAAPVITATKTDALLVDSNNDSQANPGETLRYTVTIDNSGTEDASVVFTDTIDANTTLVAGSVQSTPLARNDMYSTVGNVQLSVPVAGSLLNNDSDIDGTGGLTVSSFSATSANGAAVSVAADGSFTYNPPPGFSGTDTFTYQVDDGEGNTDPATVSVTVGQVVWFIDNAAGVPGDGRFTSPFNSIANFNALAADDPGDIIFVYQGAASYSGAVTLLNNQQLIGHGAGLALAPNLSIAAASRPALGSVALGSGNTVRGVNIATSSGTSISGASVGALTIDNVSVSSTGAGAVNLSGGASMAVSFDSVSASGGTNGIHLSNNSGSFSVNGGTIQNTSGHAIQVSNATAGPLNFTLQNSTVTNAAAGHHSIHLAVPPGGSGSFGTVTVQNNTISNNGSTGLRASIEGSGSIGLIEVAGNNFSGNDVGVDLATNDTADINFDVHNNATMSGDRAQVNIANHGSAGSLIEGRIRNNNITLNPADVGIAVWAVSDDDGDIIVDIDSNTIAGFGESGIAVESRGGTGEVHARIANNSAATTSAFALAGMFLRSGNGTVGETNRLCVNVSGNSMNGGAGAVADYYLDRLNPALTAFEIQGLSPASATPAQAESYIISTDAAPPATAFAEAGTYTAATCDTVSLALAPNAGSLAAAAQPAAGSVATVPAADAGFGRAGLASPLPVGAAAPRNAPNLSGERVLLGIGTMNAGQHLVITLDVTIDDPFPAGDTEVCNQATLDSRDTGAGGTVSIIQTDDPSVGGGADPTCTPVVVLDTTAPSVTIDQAAGQADPTNASPINFTVVFDEPVTGFADGDVTLSGTAGATTAVVTEIAPNDGTTYNVAVSGMTTSGTVVAAIPAGVATDAANNGNSASTSVDNSVTFSTTPLVSDMTIAKSHTGDFTQGQAGAQYTIAVSNGGSIPSSGTVTVVDTLPAGLTATGVAGAGWSCTLGTLTCTRGDALAAGSSYPNIVLTVDVAGNAPSSVTNSATVSGGGEQDTSNNTAADPTTVAPGSGAQLVTDPCIPGRSALLVSGTAGNDIIQLKSASGGRVKVIVNSANLGTFAPTGLVIVLGQAGNDTISVEPAILQPRILYGNGGNDTITDGFGLGVLLGGDGDDTLSSVTSRDILIGGIGADTLTGSLADDILIAGRTSYDEATAANQLALCSIYAEWSRLNLSYQARINHLTGATGGGLNGTNLLQPGQTVFDDTSVDTLTGRQGQDWFLLNRTGGGTLDTSDRSGTEIATDL